VELVVTFAGLASTDNKVADPDAMGPTNPFPALDVPKRRSPASNRASEFEGQTRHPGLGKMPRAINHE